MRDFTDDEMGSIAPAIEKLSCNGALPYSLHRFRLDRIISETKLLLYHLPTQMSSLIWPTNLQECQQRLHVELNLWNSQVSEIVDSMVLVDESDRQQWHIKLEMQYFSAVVLLFQPSQVFPKPSDEALLLCFKYSGDQIQGHNRLHEQNALYPGWRSVQSIFGCGATLIYCFWTSKFVRSSAEAANLPKMLRMCSNLLSIGGEWWPSVKQGKISFERVVDVTLQKLSEKHSGSSKKRSKQPTNDWEAQSRPIPAFKNAASQSSVVVYDSDLGFTPRMIGFQQDEMDDQSSGATFDSIYPEQMSQKLAQSWSSGTQAKPGYRSQATLHDTEIGRNVSTMNDMAQNITDETPNSIDLEIQEFLAGFWTGSQGWNELDNYAAISFDLEDLT